MNIYVASSWRNERQPAVVLNLRDAGHDVYDFRNPSDGDSGFHWSELDSEWEGWTPAKYKSMIESSPIARAGFQKDMEAMVWADAFILVMPCGRSAHLELGWACGAGKKTCILLSFFCLTESLN
jgi:hypothetical protein